MPETPRLFSSTLEPEDIALDISHDRQAAIHTLIEKQRSRNAHLIQIPVIWREMCVSAPDTGKVTVKTLPQACLNTFGVDQYNFVKNLLFPKGLGNSKTRKVLEDFTGIVKPGEMLLVLGRPGSGCSTFLRTMANRGSLEVSGELRYAGISASEFAKSHRRDTIYLPEEDQHIAALTVRQTLRFALWMSLPSEVHSAVMVEELVKNMAQMFGIFHVLDTPVGGAFFPGVSGGERKRVSIAEVLAAGASVQCFDNSTRGLDSSTALDYVKAVRKLTDAGDHTSMATLYQAGENLYNYFDKVLVIYEGRQAFFGKIDEAREYFENLGFIRTKGQTSSEFLSYITDPIHRQVTPGSAAANMHTAADFADSFKSSHYYTKLVCEIDESLSQSQKLPANLNGISSFNLSYLMQVWECLLREVQLVRGQMIVHYFKWITTIILCLTIGSEYYDFSADAQGAFTRGSLIFFALIANGWLQFPELFDAHTNRPVLERQAALHMYRPSAVALARFLVDIPLILFQNCIFVSIFYFLVKLQVKADKFFFFFFVLFLSTMCFSNLLRMFAYYVRTLDDCFRFGGTGSTIAVLFSGFLVPTKDMRPYFGWLHYLSPINYAYESNGVIRFLSTNSMDSTSTVVETWSPMSPMQTHNTRSVWWRVPKKAKSIPGLQYAEANRLYLSHKWRNVGILFAFILAYLIISMIGSEVMKFTPQGGSLLVFVKNNNQNLQLQLEDKQNVEKDVERELPNLEANEPESNLTGHIGRSLTWEKLTVDIGEKQIVNGITAYIRPGDFVSICGASGAGKTTMLKALSQTNVTGVVGGEVLYKPLGQSFKKVTGFAQQADLHDGTATVREALEFSALLRQPDIYSRAEKLTYVDTVLDMLDLKNIADALIGNESSGLGVEMTKRVTIGVELAARPRILFADEPTSGLDSEGAANIVMYLRKLSNAGQAVLVTIHQPSALVFSEFDKLLALSPEGKQLYFGPNDKALAYFSRLGAVPPPNANPAEFILEAGGAGINARKDTKGNEWAKIWEESPEAKSVLEEIHHINQAYQEDPNGGDDGICNGEFNASLSTQSWLLTVRIMKNQWRNPPYIYSKIWVHVIHAILIGTTIYKLGTSPSDLQNRMLSVFSLVLLVNTIVNTVLARFFFARLLWEAREGPSRAYGWIALCTANILAEVPGSLACGIIYYVIWYWLCGLLIGEPAVYVFLSLLTYEVFEVLFGLFMISISPGLGTAGNVLVFLVCSVNWYNGIIVPYNQIQVFWRYWLYWLNPFTYLLGGLVTAVIEDQPVICKEDDLFILNPPQNTTCGSYLLSWATSAKVQVLNPSAMDSCQLCEYTTGNQYLEGFRLGNGENGGIWGNWAIFLLFTISSFLLVYFATWATKVHRWKK